MRPADLWGLAWGALRAHRLRTRMTCAAIAIGIGSVLLLTALGEGARVWVVGQFATLGSNVLVVLPGRTETRGGAPLAPSTTREITLADMREVARRLPGVQRVVPIVIGEATAKHGGKGRAATVMGSTREFLRMRDVTPASGTELPEIEAERTANVCILGSAIARTLFSERTPLGARIRLGDHTFRVIGVLGKEGQSQMVDLDEMVLVPVASAMRMFNRSGLFRLVVEIPSAEGLKEAQRLVAGILTQRHDGEEDFTILTPGAVAESLGGIIGILTAALAAIAAVSLAVAGIGVMNVMVVSVTERTSEVGLMKALGAANRQVLQIFLSEALVLTLLGGCFGIAGGIGVARLLRAFIPAIPIQVPAWAIAAASGVAAAVGVIFGILPAMRAARLEPLESLRKKV